MRGKRIIKLILVAILIMAFTTGMVICKMDAEKKEKEKARIEKVLAEKDMAIKTYETTQKKSIKIINKGVEKIETLEKKIKELEGENARLHANRTSNSPAPARSRSAKTVSQKNFTGNVEQWRSLVAKYFPANQVNNALAVIKAESGGDPNEVNDNPKTKDYSVGLFQINLYGDLAKSRPSEEWLINPENNIAYASRVWGNSGWSPWSAARKIGLR